MNIMGKQRTALALALVLALLASACSGSGSSGSSEDASSGEATEATDESTDSGEESGEATETVERADTLSVSSIATISGFSAAKSEYGNRVLFYQASYDSLLRMEPDGTVVPWLASGWEYNEDNTVLTMTLRDDVSFTDGTPFNADAAAQNLERFKTSESPDASNLSQLDEVVVVDEFTIELHLALPDPAMIAYMARNASLMQSPATFGGADEDVFPVGTGPYILDLDATIVDSKYVFHANADYWAPEYIKYENFELSVIEDPTAVVNAIKAGEIGATTLTFSDVIPEVEGAGWDTHSQELDWVGLTLVDRDGSLGSPLGDPLVRQAISHAFDREGILMALEGGFGQVTHQVFPVTSAGFDSAIDSQYPYDIEAAKALLAEAGYAEGFTIDLPQTTLLGEAMWAIIGDSLADIGITVNWVDETADYFGGILAPKYPAYLMFLEASTNEWQFINFLLAETAVWNPSHYSDETSARLISEIQVANTEDQPALITELGAHVADEAWFVPWFRKQSTFVTDAETDVVIQPGNAIPYLFNFSPQS